MLNNWLAKNSPLNVEGGVASGTQLAPPSVERNMLGRPTGWVGLGKERPAYRTVPPALWAVISMAPAVETSPRPLLLCVQTAPWPSLLTKIPWAVVCWAPKPLLA